MSPSSASDLLRSTELQRSFGQEGGSVVVVVTIALELLSSGAVAS